MELVLFTICFLFVIAVIALTVSAASDQPVICEACGTDISIFGGGGGGHGLHGGPVNLHICPCGHQQMDR